MHPSSLDAAVHLIQVALTPIFLLSGIAALLNVFAARLAKVADRLDHLSATPGVNEDAASLAEMGALHRRSVLLDLAVLFATLGATATCLAILTLFFLGISAIDIASLLLLFFGTAIICTSGSVGLFGWEMLLGSSTLRGRMRLHAPHLRLFGSRRHAARR